MAKADRGDITQLLDDLAGQAGADGPAADQLLPLVYDELRRLAGSFFDRQDPGHTLQPTALVHEAYLRLAEHRGDGWNGREHFGGLTNEAVARVIDVSRATVANDWRFARAWLATELREVDDP